MKEIYHRLKEMKFLQIIKSFRVRAIPHPKRKAALLYSHWIFNLFYEEIYLDTLQSPKQHEIKLTHFHDLNWLFYVLFILSDFFQGLTEFYQKMHKLY